MTRSVRCKSCMLAFLAAFALTLQSAAQGNDYFVYFGTYTGFKYVHHSKTWGVGESKSKGVYVSRFNASSGQLGEPQLAAEVVNPSFLTISPDHHYLYAESYRFDPSHVIFEVAQELGIRLVFCRGGATKARKFDTPDLIPTPAEPLDRMIKSVEACAQRYHDPSPDGMRRVAFAPTTPPWSLEAEELKVVASAARRMGLRIHGHLSETSADVDFCLANFGKRPVQWMADHDYLGGDVWLAHLVHLDDEEIRILAETGTGMAHCPQSNCRLGSGIAPAERLAALGGAVSLAVDGAASNESADMISEMHSAWHTHRVVKGAGAVAVEDVVRWASAHGARVLGFEDGGVIAPGKLADLAIFDLSHPRYFGLHDPLIGPVACAGDAHLRHLIVGGRVVVSDGTIPGIDLAQLRHDAARVVTRLAS